jgi:hypothetical protein
MTPSRTLFERPRSRTRSSWLGTTGSLAHTDPPPRSSAAAPFPPPHRPNCRSAPSTRHPRPFRSRCRSSGHPARHRGALRDSPKLSRRRRAPRTRARWRESETSPGQRTTKVCVRRASLVPVVHMRTMFVTFDAAICTRSYWRAPSAIYSAVHICPLVSVAQRAAKLSSPVAMLAANFVFEPTGDQHPFALV